jgi:putative hydrolase of the HAD superfamily
VIKAVIFDLDDTLISENQYIKSGFRHIAEILSKRINKSSVFIYDKLLDLYNTSPKNVFNRLLLELNEQHTKDDIMELVTAYRSHVPVIQFYDDVVPCLRQLKEYGIKTGIITDGYKLTQRNKLQVLNADQYFDEIIVTDELGREYWKPHPKSFELMCDKLGCDYEEMLYVGDNPEKDFYIKVIKPITTVRIDREGIYKDKEYLKDIREDFKIRNLFQLIHFIHRLSFIQ